MLRTAWLQAIVDQPWRLEHAPQELQGDREIVLEVVARDGVTLRFATLELRSDREVVQTAVQNEWEALHYVPESMRGDEALIRLGRLQDVAAIACASRELRIQLMPEAVDESARRGSRSEHRAPRATSPTTLANEKKKS